MPVTIKPGRNATLKLAYALMAAEEKKVKKAAKKEPEAEPPKKAVKGKRK